MTFRAQLCAFLYPKVIIPAEKAGLATIRRTLLANAQGPTLEVGAGSGINLRHYQPNSYPLCMVDTSEFMIDALEQSGPRKKAPESVASQISVVMADASNLPFDDNTFETVVGTFFNCAVDDPDKILDEIHRVTKPGGQYLFMEHVKAPPGTWTERMQNLIVRPQMFVFDGCKPNVDFERFLERSQFDEISFEVVAMPKSPPTMRRMLVGAAVKRKTGVQGGTT